MAKNKKKLANKAKPANRTAQLICPRCTLYHADLRYSYDTAVRAQDVTVHTGDKLKDGDEITCPGCQHVYSNYDIWLCIAAKKTALAPGTHATKKVAAASDVDERGEPDEQAAVESKSP